MSTVWNAATYDTERRRLVPCFDEFYGTAADLVARTCPARPRILDLGAGTGILSDTIASRVQIASLTLLDVSSEMLERAAARLVRFKPKVVVAPLTAPLPAGPFDAVVSALAIHHLSDKEKQALLNHVFGALAPGGLFVNAEQVSGASPRLRELFEATHLDRARSLGSSESEIAGAVERMRQDRCSTVDEQLVWLSKAGFRDVECFFRYFRFAVFGGWKPGGRDS